jgi:hypothetical protein
MDAQKVFNQKANKLRLKGHGGTIGHPDVYHEWVYDHLGRAIGSKQETAAAQATTDALTKMKSLLADYPDLIHIGPYPKLW